MTHLRRIIVVLGAVLAATVIVPAAWAYFTSIGTGSASASISSLAAPSDVSATSSGGTVAVNWTGHPAPDGGLITGYYVHRSSGTPSGSCFSSPTSLLPATATGCSDSNVPSATYTYTVVAVFRSWTASASSSPVTVTAGVADHFQVSAPGSAAAGASFNVTITAKDANDSTAPMYSGVKTVVWSGPGPGPNGSGPTYPGSVTFTDGVGLASITLAKAETVVLSATEGTMAGDSASILVNPGAATQFAVVAASPQAAGTSFNVGVTARDVYQNTAISHAGVHTLLWSGPGTAPNGATAAFPNSVTFTNGVGTAPVTLVKAEIASVTANEGAISGTSSIMVNPGPTARLRFTSSSHDCSANPVSVGTGGTFTSKVGLFDAYLNPTAATSTTAVTLSNNRANAGLSPTSLSVAIGSGETGSSFSQSQIENTQIVTARSGSLTEVTCNVKK